MSGPLDPRRRVVVRRDRDRRSSRAAGGSTPTSSRARPRSTPRPAGSSPRSPPEPTSAGSCRSSTRRWPTPASTVGDVDAVAVTYGPGLAGSLLVGINFAKTLAFVHDKPLVGVNHLEGHLYAAWLLDPGEAEREEPVFPLVALIVSGGHTFLVEMRDHLTYRLLGQTVDDAAGEAFDKVGRLLGLPYPGGPAIQRAAEARDAPRRRVPAGVARRHVRLQLLGPQDRRAPDGRRGARRGRPAAGARRPSRRPTVRRRDRRARLGLPGFGRRRARDEDDPGGRGGRCAVDRARRRRCRERARSGRGSPARPRRAACRSSCRGRGSARTTGR